MHLVRRPIFLALAGALFVALLVPLESWIFIGNDWKGVIQSYGDEIIYEIHAQEIAKGHLNDGNPYYIEHADDPPLVLFAGTYLAAVPLMLGIPSAYAFFLDFALWSVILVALWYWFFRELYMPKWAAALGAWFVFAQFCGLVFRVSSRQEVYPVFALFCIGLARLIKDPLNRWNIALLAAATGLSFYVFSYLWQSAVVILGLTVLWALVRRDYPLVRGALLSSLFGGLLGLPSLLYMWWMSHLPYFWESIARFGLVHTHLPGAEAIYSGGWTAVILVLVALLYWRSRALFADKEFAHTALWATLSGLGLWAMMWSNAVTGTWLETGEHMKPSIVSWLALATVVLGSLVWRHRAQLSRAAQAACVAALGVCAVVSVYFGYQHLTKFLLLIDPVEWREQQTFAAPINWLESHEQSPVVVWAGVNDYVGVHIPLLSRNYVLFGQMATFTLVSDAEIRERYLVARYFENPSVDDLIQDLPNFVGRGDAYHKAKTVERGVKICRIVFFWDKTHDCGAVPTSAQLLGDTFFENMEKQFTQDIKPNIRTYLKKYHVSYVLKDEKHDISWHPEKLGGTLVYDDGNFALYKLPE